MAYFVGSSFCSLQSLLIASLVQPVIPLNFADPLGIRPLAVFLLRWDRRQAAAEGPLPTTAAAGLSTFLSVSCVRKKLKQGVLLCWRAEGCVCMEWKHSWLNREEGLVGTTVSAGN